MTRPSRLEEARERARRASPGPWRHNGEMVWHDQPIQGADGDYDVGDIIADGIPTLADATFIAASRTDLPDALDVVEAAAKAAAILEYEVTVVMLPTQRKRLSDLAAELRAVTASWTRQPEGGEE